MTRKVFYKLLGLFALLLAFQATAMVLVFVPMLGSRVLAMSPSATFRLLGPQVMYAGLIALAIVLPLAAWFALSISRRLRRLMHFANRIADGDLKARLQDQHRDELSAMVQVLNTTAARLEASFTELENRRRELAALLDSMQEGVVAITVDGNVSWSNAVMQRLAGTQIRQGLPLVHSVRDPDVLGCVAGALRDHKLRYGRASSLAPGRVFEINAAPTPGGGAVVVLHDVTQIEAAEKSRRDFIANVSHELRTPLTSISGYVETLLEFPATNPETNREFLNIILKNSNRMSRLTEDLLALATIESPDYKLKRRGIKASALLEDAIESLAGMVGDAGMELVPSGATHSLVVADADAMNQVFGNLIENALKYGRSGKRIEVGALDLDDEVEFYVRDFGQGIAYEHLNRIFERFYRVDKARSRDSGGTGLGLAIVKHIVQAHGGRIWAESELGAGAAFHFTLPMVVREALHGPQEVTAATREQAQEHAGSEPAMLRGRIVEERNDVQSDPVQLPVTLGADNKAVAVAKGIQP